MKEIICGKKTFPNKIDITDPCYSRNVWCRINDYEIPAGEYKCYIKEKSDKETGGWGKRVAKIGIRKEKADNYTKIGYIGVDAGLAGFFFDKPDYTDDQWNELCNMVRNGNAWIVDYGFFSESGYGDGSYDVYVGHKDGEVVEVFIDFI